MDAIKGMKSASGMREKVKTEVGKIPRGSLPQNFLRCMYSGMRMHSLGKNAEKETTPREVLEKCIEHIKKDEDFKKKYPNFVPEYDRTFFR